MKTTEIFVEHVLIGAIVLIVTALFLGFGVADLAETKNAVAATVAVFGLGAAYLSGIVYDRVDDTILEGIDGRSRLREASRIVKERAKLRYEDVAKLRHDDPLPEERLRLLIQSADKTVADYADFLR